MPLNELFLQELKSKTDIEDIISSYISLKKRGSTSIGLCPFHNEKTPSFTVYNDTQSFYCFGCGAGGDAITFLKKIENLDYIDAVKALAQRAGIQMPEDNSFDDSLSKKRRRILEINRETARFYHSYLMSEQGKVGLNYFLNRGLKPATIKKFGLGYAPNEWDRLIKHLKSLGFKPVEMVEAGVVRLSKNNHYYDTFKNRTITPIIDVRGNVIAFGGRVLDDSKPKYINTSDTLVYKKTNELFALNFAKNSGKDSLILCEGYMDVISMHQAGFTNAVAGCGTALTNEQVRLISRYAGEVILVYDNDDAGRKALNKAVSLFHQTDVKVKIPVLKGGKDPDEILRKFGRDKFKGMLEGASNDIEFAIIELRSKFNLESSQGKIDFLNSVIKILGEATPIEQDIYISRLSDELGIDKNSIKAQLSSFVKRNSRGRAKKQFKAIIDTSISDVHKQERDNNAPIKLIKAQERLIALLLMYPDCSSIKLDANFMTSDFYKKVYEFIIYRIEENLGIDLMDFSSVLSDDELGRLSGIIARNGESKDSKKEFLDCASVISAHNNENDTKSSRQLSDDEFRDLFKKRST